MRARPEAPTVATRMLSTRILATVAAFLLVATGIALADGRWIAAALPLAAWVLASRFGSPPRLELEAERRLSSSFLEPAPATVGGYAASEASEAYALVRVEVEVRNLGNHLDFLALSDPIPPDTAVADGKSDWRGSLERGASVVLRYSLRVGRGVHGFSSISAFAQDAFLATSAEAELPCPGRIVAPPRLLAPPALSFAAPSARPFSGASRALRTGTGTDFAGTREYCPGDPLRSLNWRAEALWGASIVNIHEEERALDVGIILDCRAQAYDREALFEAAVSAAASLAEALLDGGHRVAFLNYGSTIEWTPPGSGRGQRAKVRAAAAKAELGDHVAFERFDNVPARLFPPRSLVLLVSPLRREDLVPLRTLMALGYALCALKPEIASGDFPDAANGREKREAAESLALRMTALESATLDARLLRAGAEVLSWDIGRPLAAARSIGAARGSGEAAQAVRARGGRA